MSFISWIDYDESERQRALRILELFSDRESRDELGLGAIRDSISDLLFPGTNTIQTRLRYMLFVPWLLRSLEAEKGTRAQTPAQLRAKARELEVRLIDALIAGEATKNNDGSNSKGIIGSEAKATLKRLPSSIYWLGLGQWEIRCFDGSIENLFAKLAKRAPQALESGEDGAITEGQKDHLWTPDLPPAPEKLLEEISFELTTGEAQFIKERIQATHSDSLLAHLANTCPEVNLECDAIWNHPGRSDFKPHQQQLVHHAEMFSALMHGASLMYNWALSRLSGNEELIDRYEQRLTNWRTRFKQLDFDTWSLESFWADTRHGAHKIRPTTEKFVQTWLQCVLQCKGDVLASEEARLMIETRERSVKRGASRFANTNALKNWSGAAGAERLNFRWPTARSHLHDIANAS